MPEIPVLHDIVVIFGVALLVIAVSSRLHVPPVVGFLLTGMIVGPHGTQLVTDTEHVKIFAELGVVFLLFIVGLELSPARLKRLARVILLGGGIQTICTILLVTGLSVALGYGLRTAVFFSFLVTLSSTALVLKLYSERREIDMPHGEAAMGILLFQDFLIVPLLLVVPVLAGQGDTSLGDFAIRFGGGLFAVFLFFLAGRYLLPHLLHILVYTQIRELFVIGALFACLGTALVTEELGFSLALGAFLAGLMIAESDYRYQVLAETGSFRDVFNSLFFISVGMLLQLDFALTNGLMIIGLGGAVLLLKFGALLVAISALGYGWRTRIIAALGLAQLSEFSFVLIQVGEGFGLLDAWHYQTAIATAVLTMILTPVLVNFGPVLARRIVGSDTEAATEDETPTDNEVVIVGYGHNGRYLARALKTAGISYVIAEMNGRLAREAKNAGEPVIFGDTTRHEIQQKCGVADAKVAIFAFTDRAALRDSVRLARAMNPEIFVVVRTKEVEEAEVLQQCGADMVVTEEMEASVKLMAVALSHLRISNETIREELRRMRKEGFHLLKDLEVTLTDPIMQALETDPSRTYQLTDGHVQRARTLQEFDLQALGVAVIAVCRGAETLVAPEPEMALAAGDVMILTGSHAQLNRAQQSLEAMS